VEMKKLFLIILGLIIGFTALIEPVLAYSRDPAGSGEYDTFTINLDVADFVGCNEAQPNSIYITGAPAITYTTPVQNGVQDSYVFESSILNPGNDPLGVIKISIVAGASECNVLEYDADNVLFTFTSTPTPPPTPPASVEDNIRNMSTEIFTFFTSIIVFALAGLFGVAIALWAYNKLIKRL